MADGRSSGGRRVEQDSLDAALAGAASASADSTVKVWDARTGKELLTLTEGHSARVFGMAYSPDGKRVVSASEDRTAEHDRQAQRAVSAAGRGDGFGM